MLTIGSRVTSSNLLNGHGAHQRPFLWYDLFSRNPPMTTTYTRLKSSYRFQVVLLMPDGKESDHWTDLKETAHGVARSMRERNPMASRVVVYDHSPTATEF